MKRKPNLHEEIVEGILPQYGDRLKAEGLIIKHNRAHIVTRVSDDFEPIRIRPDRLLYLQDGTRFLVEIVNPRDPKRLIGEVVYAHVLKYCDTISGAIFFCLPTKHNTLQKRVMSQHWALTDVMKTSGNYVIFPWSGSEEINYENLKSQLSLLRKNNKLIH